MTERVKNTMIIDDSEIDLLVNESVLKFAGFTGNIVAKQSAAEALKYLNENSGLTNRIPDIIFLDIRMPDMNGFGFLEEYCKLPRAITQKSKVIMLTSSLDDNDMRNAKNNKYVIDYLVKPLTEEALNGLKL
jgi:CheY-like chemotaxis protein